MKTYTEDITDSRITLSWYTSWWRTSTWVSSLTDFPHVYWVTLAFFTWFTLSHTPFHTLCRHQNSLPVCQILKLRKKIPQKRKKHEKKEFYPGFFLFLRIFLLSFLVHSFTRILTSEYTALCEDDSDGLHLSSSKFYLLSIVDNSNLWSIVDW